MRISAICGRASAALMLVAAMQPGPARAARLRTLHSFCAQSGCADGMEPAAGLTADAAGNLYGTTLFGGTNGGGTVFELKPNARRTKWAFKPVYSFCALSNCADGADPFTDLVVDSSGALYGTTMTGGANNGGVVFMLKPNARHTQWTQSVLYAFCSASDCTDGRAPEAGLSYAGQETGSAYDGTSPLYGTTFQAGANKQGTAFVLTRKSGQWTQQVIYDFCTQPGCADGSSPAAALTLDTSGNLFGTTYYGGAANAGTAFQLSSAAGRRGAARMTQTVLHSFCSSANCADGAFPAAPLRRDGAGHLLGTTFGGGEKGRHCDDIGVSGCGTMFKLVPNGAASQETVLYDFCAKKNCADGGYPLAGVTLDGSGNILGASLYGGGHGDAPGSGTIFTLNGSERPLYRFCTQPDCADGRGPEGNLTIDSFGNVFGTTLFAGANGQGGTVFELVP